MENINYDQTKPSQPPDIEQLLHDLSLEADADWETRCASVEALGTLKDERALDALIKVIENDSKLEVRSAATTALSNFEDVRAIEALVKVSNERDRRLRSNAAMALGQIGTAAVLFLQKIITNSAEPEQSRLGAIRVLAYTHDASSGPLLLEILQDKKLSNDIRISTVFTLANIDYTQGVETLISIFKDQSEPWFLRASVAEHYLPKLHTRGLNLLVEALYEDGFGEMFGMGLASFDTEAIPPLLLALQNKENVQARINAASTLHKLAVRHRFSPIFDDNSSEAALLVEALIQALNDDNDSVRTGILLALTDFNNEHVIEPLIRLLKDSNQSVRFFTAQTISLIQLKDPRFLEPLLETLKYNRDWAMAGMAAVALTRLGYVQAVEPMLELLESDNAETRHYTAQALGSLKDSRAIKGLYQLAQTIEAPINIVATRSIAQIGGAEALELLKRLLESDNIILCKNAAEALGLYGDISALEPLTRLKETAVAVEVIEAVTKAIQQIEQRTAST